MIFLETGGDGRVSGVHGQKSLVPGHLLAAVLRRSFALVAARNS